MEGNGAGPRWVLVVKPEQAELIQILQERLEGSGVHVFVERRTRERRRGSLGRGREGRGGEDEDRRERGLTGQRSTMTSNPP